MAVASSKVYREQFQVLPRPRSRHKRIGDEFYGVIVGGPATGCRTLEKAMDVDVVNTVIINRAVGDVSQYAADPDNAPNWYENIKSVEWKTPHPAQVGSRIDFVAHFLGRRLAYTYEFVEFVPGRRLTMRTPGPPFPMETTYTWGDKNGSTRMTLRNRGTPRGFAAWLAPLVSLMIGRANKKDLALLKRRLERDIQ